MNNFRAKKVTIAVLVVLLIGVVAYQSDSANESCLVDPALSYEVNGVLDVDDARIMIQNRLGSEDFVLLDIRTREEYESGHIEGAINIDYYSADFKSELEELDKEKVYLIYCRTANRTIDGSRIMSEMGFKEIYSMSGGIVEWEFQGLPIVKSDEG